MGWFILTKAVDRSSVIHQKIKNPPTESIYLHDIKEKAFHSAGPQNNKNRSCIFLQCVKTFLKSLFLLVCSFPLHLMSSPLPILSFHPHHCFPSMLFYFNRRTVKRQNSRWPLMCWPGLAICSQSKTGTGLGIRRRVITCSLLPSI